MSLFRKAQEFFSGKSTQPTTPIRHIASQDFVDAHLVITDLYDVERPVEEINLDNQMNAYTQMQVNGDGIPRHNGKDVTR